MLTWRTEAEGMFIVGSAKDYGNEVIFTTDDKELMYVSRGLTPDEFRQVADKLEELTRRFHIVKTYHAYPEEGRVCHLFHGKENLGYYYEKRKHLGFSVTGRKILTHEEQEKVNEIIHGEQGEEGCEIIAEEYLK